MPDQYGYGDFGNLRSYYEEGRQGFPEEVIDRFLSRIANRSPRVLDIGCGTGIATRQLARSNVTLFGMDRDPMMIEAARSRGPASIQYLVGSAGRIPFANHEFDGIAAFSAFHWFKDRDSIREIRRVLKNDGILLATNKNDPPGTEKLSHLIYNKKLSGFLPKGQTFNSKMDYNPGEILRGEGFTVIEDRRFIVKEVFTVPQATAFLQSISKWNLIKEVDKAEALGIVKDYLNAIAKDGVVTDDVEIWCTMARPQQ